MPFHFQRRRRLLGAVQLRIDSSLHHHALRFITSIHHFEHLASCIEDHQEFPMQTHETIFRYSTMVYLGPRSIGLPSMNSLSRDVTIYTYYELINSIFMDIISLLGIRMNACDVSTCIMRKQAKFSKQGGGPMRRPCVAQLKQHQ